MTDGSKPRDAPVTRGELERALRHVNFLVASLRDDLLSLGAQVATLMNELSKNDVLDEDSVTEAMKAAVESIRIVDEGVDPPRVDLAPIHVSKYDLEELPIPCDELVHLCEARCCRLGFTLNTQDLDEGVIRWDYGRPYWVLQRAEDGYCAHNQPGTRRCGEYAARPAPCREFDCREDPRIWIDYEQRIPAPESAIESDSDEMIPGSEISPAEREEHRSTVRQRQIAMFFERAALERLYGKQDGESEEDS